jgi:glycosyltransferase involved in cell wall biosynthesis
LPQATIYVYDNNSTDGTIAVARAAGAVVRRETHQGKGNVVRRMFSDIDADVYVLVDGDATYHAASAPAMIARLLDERLDIVVGARVHQDEAAYRPGHVTGNRLLTGFIDMVFGATFTDILSGYRVFSRRFVKSFPVLSGGFEIETELTVHALELRLPIAEMSTTYRERPAGSTSKLRTYSDGWRILRTIFALVKGEKPLQFFSFVFALLFAASVALGVPVVIEYAETGLVPRLPTAVLSATLMMLGCLALVCGLVLDTVTRGRIEAKRLHYLSLPIRFSPLQSLNARGKTRHA